MKTPIRVTRKGRPPKFSDDEATEMFRTLRNESERGSALVAVALIEDALGHALESRLVGPERDVDSFLRGTLASKLKLARALGLIEEAFSDECEAVASVRNAFAHTRSAVKFSDPDLERSCQSLTVPLRLHDKHGVQLKSRTCYELSAATLAAFLHLYLVKGTGLGTDLAFSDWIDGAVEGLTPEGLRRMDALGSVRAL